MDMNNENNYTRLCGHIAGSPVYSHSSPLHHVFPEIFYVITFFLFTIIFVKFCLKHAHTGLTIE